MVQVAKMCDGWREEIAQQGIRAERCQRLLRRIPGTREHAGESEREAKIWALGQAAFAAEERLHAGGGSAKL
jgi:hypothetical protein